MGFPDFPEHRRVFMKSRNIADFCKDAMGTVFLLAGAFFVCSTFLSIRAVFADPIAPTTQSSVATPQATRAGTNVRSSSRPATTRSSSTNTVSRGTANTTTAATSRAVVSRTATTPTVSRTTTGATTTTASSRPSTTANRTTASTTGTTRNVVSRTGTNTTSRVAVNNNRNVISRGTTNARVSLQGSAIRGSKAATNTYTYLSNALYTGNYSNIIDSSTGLISAEAYNNCMESYFACMDEICTARNSAQRRCACAGRVRAFAEAEEALETANEELIKVSGELALLIATKGKDVSQAFQLTDAEKVMNCVSWKEAYKDGTWTTGTTDSEAYKWCTSHGIYEGAENCPQPSYCTSGGNNFGFDISTLEGSGSDILASLQAWADAKDSTVTILTSDENNLTNSLNNLVGAVGNITGINTDAFGTDSTLKDSLAETWGYELFEYAHNNVCNRVLDSCFNGIYEACGTPPSNGRKCGNGQSQCPYNYNSYISVSNTGTYELDFITPDTGYTASNSATCFGYSSASGDPYSSLRGPVADARRSIMQQYALAANADCDAYGEQLRTQAQNIGYQKVAAQQALQQKRLEFAQEEQESLLTNYSTARNNFNLCLSELYDCYTTQEKSNPSWSTSRIKTYCAQVSNIPHCYDTMVCGPAGGILQAVVDYQEDDKTTACDVTNDYKTNTCRNIITISEVLSGNYALDATEGSSIALREQCLQEIGIDGVRNWASTNSDGGWTSTSCPSGQHLEGNSCVPNTKTCTHSDTNAATAQQTWSTTTQSWSGCQIQTCKSGFTLSGGQCISAGN